MALVVQYKRTRNPLRQIQLTRSVKGRVALTRIDVDPRRDGFGHHNPNLNIEDDLFYNALAVDRVIEGLFRGQELSAAEEQFMRLIRLGILDEREGFDMPMTAATRAMRHSSVTAMRLWAMYENERQRVCVLQALGD